MSSNSIYQEISSLYLAGSTIDQLQKQFHKSFVFIKQALKETNTPLRTPTNFEYDFDTVKSMAEQNYSKKDVVEQLGGSVRVLDAFLKKNNSSWNNIKPLSEIDTKWDQIVECRTVHKMSCIEIVESLELNCTEGNIHARLQQHNILPLTKMEEYVARQRRNIKRYGVKHTSQLDDVKYKNRMSVIASQSLNRQLITHVDISHIIKIQPFGYYVYLLYHPNNNGKPFYIGKGSKDRYLHHILAAIYDWKDCNYHKINIIRKYLKKDHLPVIGFYPCNSEKEALHLETELIKYWGRQKDHGPLVNLTKGGEGYTAGERPVDQYDLFGQYIQTFPSLLDATKSCGKTCSSSIIACCKKTGTQKAAYNYFWTYHNEPLDIEWCWSTKKPVIKKDLLGNIVEKFTSKTQAGLSVSVSSFAISKAIKTGKIFKGHYWEHLPITKTIN